MGEEIVMYKCKWRWKGVAIDNQLSKEAESERRIWGKKLYGLKQNRSKLSAENL